MPRVSATTPPSSARRSRALRVRPERARDDAEAREDVREVHLRARGGRIAGGTGRGARSEAGGRGVRRRVVVLGGRARRGERVARAASARREARTREARGGRERGRRCADAAKRRARTTTTTLANRRTTRDDARAWLRGRGRASGEARDERRRGGFRAHGRGRARWREGDDCNAGGRARAPPRPSGRVPTWRCARHTKTCCTSTGMTGQRDLMRTSGRVGSIERSPRRDRAPLPLPLARGTHQRARDDARDVVRVGAGRAPSPRAPIVRRTLVASRRTRPSSSIAPRSRLEPGADLPRRPRRPTSLLASRVGRARARASLRGRHPAHRDALRGGVQGGGGADARGRGRPPRGRRRVPRVAVRAGDDQGPHERHRSCGTSARSAARRREAHAEHGRIRARATARELQALQRTRTSVDALTTEQLVDMRARISTRSRSRWNRMPNSPARRRRPARPREAVDATRRGRQGPRRRQDRPGLRPGRGGDDAKTEREVPKRRGGGGGASRSGPGGGGRRPRRSRGRWSRARRSRCASRMRRSAAVPERSTVPSVPRERRRRARGEARVGVATAVIARAERISRLWGFEEMWLHVNIDNPGARKLVRGARVRASS